MGLEIINNISFHIWQENEFIPIQFLKYALVNCPHLHYFHLESLDLSWHNICISPQDCHLKTSKSRDPLTNSTQQNLKKIRVERYPPQQILDLLSAFLPDLEIMAFVHQYVLENNFRNPKSYTFNLKALKNLTAFFFDIRSVVGICEYNLRKDFEFLFIHFNSTGQREWNAFQCYCYRYWFLLQKNGIERTLFVQSSSSLNATK
jgi:hypothetical protein